jgi:hypothetical protein
LRAHHDGIPAALCRVSTGRQFPNALRPVAGLLWELNSTRDHATEGDPPNLAIWVGAEMERMMAAAGVDVSAAQSNDAWMLPIPTTFIVDHDGVIPHRGIEEMLAALRRAP